MFVNPEQGNQLALADAAGSRRGAADADRAEVVTLTPDRLPCIVVLSRPWSYRAGDDPSWAEPDLDDASWPLVRPDLREVPAVAGGWTGIGWFRRRVMLAAPTGRAARRTLRPPPTLQRAFGAPRPFHRRL